MNKHDKKIVIVGGGVSGACAATKLVDNGYPGELITIIDMGKDPYNRKPEEVMSGWLGCGGWSDGKLTRHHQIGGHLSKYVGEKRAYELMDESINLWKRYHPKPSEMMYSNPTEEPDFIKPYFNLRLFGVHHIGTDYLHEIGKNWYDDLVSKGVNFKWEQKVTAIDFKRHKLTIGDKRKEPYSSEYYDKLIFAVGKSGIDFGKQLEDQYKFETEPKPVQIGVRFEAPQHHFQKLIDISYDFKLYKKFEEERVSLRSFCLPESEVINIKRGEKILFDNINNITLKDKVLTYNFNRGVTEFINPSKLYNREYKGNLISINNKLNTTEDHIYFVWEKELIKDEYNRKDSYKDNAFKLNKIVEKSAKDLIIGDRLVTPKHFPRLNQNRYTKYSNGYLYLFGLWFADGSGNYKSKGDIKNFTLTNEDYILDEIINILERNQERYTSKKIYDSYSVLNFYSPLLKEFLIQENCFKKGKERGLPESIFNWSEEEIYSFLSGLIDGDGRVKKEHNICLDYFTVSDLLYRDLTYLFNYLGISYKSRTRKSPTNFKEDSQINIINISQRDSMLLLSNKLSLKNLNKHNLLQENLKFEIKERDTKNYEKVHSIESEHYEGIVYDIEIPNSHNFIAGNTPIVIHNCTNNNAAYVALEETYGDYSYNGHAKKDESFRNDMTNFGILMQIHGIENPFEWTRNVTKKLQKNGKGLFYSPSRKPSLTSEGERVPTHQVESLDVLKDAMGEKYAQYLISFIEDLKKVFPTLQDDYGVYMPEVKYLNSEVKIDHDKFSILKYPNVYFTGDALSARGITVSGSHGVLAAESIIKGE